MAVHLFLVVGQIEYKLHGGDHQQMTDEAIVYDLLHSVFFERKYKQFGLLSHCSLIFLR